MGRGYLSTKIILLIFYGIQLKQQFMRTYSGPELTEIIQNKADELARMSSEIVLNNRDVLNQDGPEQMVTISNMLVQIADGVQEMYPDMRFSNLSQLSSYLLHENLAILKLKASQ
jgi:hypothetical protein